MQSWKADQQRVQFRPTVIHACECSSSFAESRTPKGMIIAVQPVELAASLDPAQ